MSFSAIIICSGALLVAAHLFISCARFREIPDTLSRTHYMWKSAGLPWVFTAVLGCAAGTMLPFWLETASGTWYQFTAFTACGGLMFTAFAPEYFESLSREVHIGGVVVAGASALAFEIASGLALVPAACAVLGAIGCAIRPKSWCLWLEMSVFLSAYVSLFILVG